ncbi:hypothetical protein Gotur_033847 [Gossypium turneri]
MADFTDELAQQTLKDHGLVVLPCIKEQRGDIPKAMQIYMIEKGISEGKARDHVKELISYA